MYIFLGNILDGIYVPCPEKYLVLKPKIDYKNLTLADVKKITGTVDNPTVKTVGSEIMPAEYETSVTESSLMDKLNKNKDLIDSLNDQMDNIRQEKESSLAAIRLEIQKLQDELYNKKQALLSELNLKMEAMAEQKYYLENQIYMIESQIYAIRCYSGETINFSKIRSGKPSSIDTPLIIYQKLRYLDEDLGRMTSLYQISWNSINLFEEFIKYSDAAFETFVPNDKCLVLIRLSKTGTTIGRNDNFPYSNILRKYDYYHGKTIGILIRNGENLYLGWTDENYIDIQDDLIIRSVITDISPYNPDENRSEFDKKKEIDEFRKSKRLVMKEIMSRSFIYRSGVLL